MIMLKAFVQHSEQAGDRIKGLSDPLLSVAVASGRWVDMKVLMRELGSQNTKWRN